MNKVDVLLSTYNGERYIEEQIESIVKQKNVDVNIVIRDDGSTDNTINIIQRLMNLNYPISLIKGKNIGVINSFLCLASLDSDSEYFAFCDQDDFWEAEKLVAAIEKIAGKNKPSLYLSDTTVVDEKLQPIDLQILNHNQKYVYCLEEVLLGNNATGCTMVFNAELKKMLDMYTPEKIIMHDHWLYALCIAIDGFVYFDKNSYIKYRQHGNNTVGNNVTFINKIKYSSLKKGKSVRSTIARQLLQNYCSYMTKQNKLLLEKISTYNTSLKNKMSVYQLLKSYVCGKKRRAYLGIQILLNLY